MAEQRHPRTLGPACGRKSARMQQPNGDDAAAMLRAHLHVAASASAAGSGSIPAPAVARCQSEMVRVAHPGSHGHKRRAHDFFTTRLPLDVLPVVEASAGPHEQQDEAIKKWTATCLRAGGDPATCPMWLEIRQEAARLANEEQLLGSYLHSTILNHNSLAKALSYHLSTKLEDTCFNCMQWHALFDEVFETLDRDFKIRMAIRDDLMAIRTRDAACNSVLDAFLYYKGFLGLESYRMAHALWTAGRKHLARLLQSRISTVFTMDIHPACLLGRGLMFDHANGVVIGETAVVGDGCSFLHNVTLGGTGKHGGDRHPKLGKNISVGAGCSILGNIQIGDNVKIGAGSVVLSPLSEGVTAVGIPARVIVPKSASETSLDSTQLDASQGGKHEGGRAGQAHPNGQAQGSRQRHGGGGGAGRGGEGAGDNLALDEGDEGDEGEEEGTEASMGASGDMGLSDGMALSPTVSQGFERLT